jgi:hypothetical protein
MNNSIQVIDYNEIVGYVRAEIWGEKLTPFDLDPKIPVHYVGDAQKVGKAENAIHDAYNLALTL